jgi:hypothetical protein
MPVADFRYSELIDSADVTEAKDIPRVRLVIDSSSLRLTTSNGAVFFLERVDLPDMRNHFFEIALAAVNGVGLHARAVDPAVHAMEAVADRAFQHLVWGGVQVDAVLRAEVNAALPSVSHDFDEVRVQQDLAPVGEFDVGEPGVFVYDLLKFSNLKKPEPRVRPISPDAVGQEGQFSWQTVAASSRMLPGRRGRLMIREV